MSESETAAPPHEPVLVAELGDFEGLDIDSVVAGIAPDEWLLRRAFYDAAEAARSTGADGHGRALDLISHLVGLPLRPDDPAGPFGARRVGMDARSHIASDFRGAQSAVLSAIAPEIGNSALRARLADVAWENDHTLTLAGRTAVDAYVTCIDERMTRPNADEDLGERLSLAYAHRAMQISARLHGRRKMPSSVDQAFRRVLEAARHRTDFSAYVRLAHLGVEYGVFSHAEIAPKAEALADAPGPRTWAMARKMAWSLAAEAYNRSGDKAAAARCVGRMVDLTLVLRDEVSSAHTKAYWTRVAIGELRSGGNDKARIQRLRGELRDLQDESLDDYVSQTIPIDVADERAETFDLYDNFDLPQALLQFALIVDSPKRDDLRKEALENLDKFVSKKLFGGSYADAEGKTTSETGAASDQPTEAWFKEEALLSLGIHRSFMVGGHIEPARQAIFDRFPLEQRHFAAIAELSPFIPRGHEYLFALGFARFWQGDFASATYLLTPLIEHGIRHVMLNADVDTSKMKPNLLQQDRALSGLLSSELRPDMDRIFGVDLMFEVEMLFIHQPGPALRHQVAHGMLPAGGCFHPDAVYACWLVYRLACLPLVKYWPTHVAPGIVAML
ncbi:DUF4209 domain-containing protein [Brevundimonas variabilis]|uniref:DUF4209 domain-containing protein n=1 Tax=Brevundimonas variabilis TaxID=74312 RepID=A0A7W9CJH4_9CAUL|nr:DUF4209 domain-containing protein [Brevundimonas variabilis]MBB5746568.1 hypothetical protein [Brevundimonas variabilis]